MDHTLTDIIEIKKDIEEIYRKGAFKDVAGRRLLVFFMGRKMLNPRLRRGEPLLT